MQGLLSHFFTWCESRAGGRGPLAYEIHFLNAMYVLSDESYHRVEQLTGHYWYVTTTLGLNSGLSLKSYTSNGSFTLLETDSPMAIRNLMATLYYGLTIQWLSQTGFTVCFSIFSVLPGGTRLPELNACIWKYGRLCNRKLNVSVTTSRFPSLRAIHT